MKAYLPLSTYNVEQLAPFVNGVRIASRDEISPISLNDWSEVLTGEEIRSMRDWQWALLYESSNQVEVSNVVPPNLLADTQLSLQVLRPQGNATAFCVSEGTLAHTDSVVLTRYNKFVGTAWSRMESIFSASDPSSQQIVDGTLAVLRAGDARAENPLRLFEQGMTSSNTYIRILLWVTALDGILMAVKKDNFVVRLSALLDEQAFIFPPSDGVYIERYTRVIDVAEDLFQLRSELAHGSAISRKFWEKRPDLEHMFPQQAYGENPRYVTLLEECALALFCAVIRTIVKNGLTADYLDVKSWRQTLKKMG